MLRTAPDDPAEDSVDVDDSELAERVVFLCVASDGLLVVAGAVLVAVVFLCVCCGEVTDSSDSSALDAAWRKQFVRTAILHTNLHHASSHTSTGTADEIGGVVISIFYMKIREGADRVTVETCHV